MCVCRVQYVPLCTRKPKIQPPTLYCIPCSIEALGSTALLLHTFDGVVPMPRKAGFSCAFRRLHSVCGVCVCVWLVSTANNRAKAEVEIFFTFAKQNHPFVEDRFRAHCSLSLSLSLSFWIAVWVLACCHNEHTVRPKGDDEEWVSNERSLVCFWFCLVRSRCLTWEEAAVVSPVMYSTVQ